MCDFGGKILTGEVLSNFLSVVTHNSDNHARLAPSSCPSYGRAVAGGRPLQPMLPYYGTS